MKDLAEAILVGLGALLLAAAGLVALVFVALLPYLFIGGVLGAIGFACWWVFKALMGIAA